MSAIVQFKIVCPISTDLVKNLRGVLWLPRTPRQSILCVSGIRDRILFGAFVHEG
jgi:hypothetical protein